MVLPEELAAGASLLSGARFPGVSTCFCLFLGAQICFLVFIMPVTAAQRRAAKRIVVCCDGTWVNSLGKGYVLNSYGGGGGGGRTRYQGCGRRFLTSSHLATIRPPMLRASPGPSHAPASMARTRSSRTTAAWGRGIPCSRE